MMQLQTGAETRSDVASLNVAVGNLAVLNLGITSRKCHKTIYVLYSSTAGEEEYGTAFPAVKLVLISQGPKNWGIPGPNPLPPPHVMYMNTSKTLCTGLYKS
jgi:hypothetical protein